jgi:hypothetical protein
VKGASRIDGGEKILDGTGRWMGQSSGLLGVALKSKGELFVGENLMGVG